MKKLLLLLTIMFAFVTITFANTKKTTAKNIVKKEVTKIGKKSSLKKKSSLANESCVYYILVQEFEEGQLVSHIEFNIDWDCMNQKPITPPVGTVS